MERDVNMEMEEAEMEDRETEGRGWIHTFTMNMAAPEVNPPLPSFLLLSTPTTDCWLMFC
jgi:uncharacterized OB-fold protein